MASALGPGDSILHLQFTKTAPRQTLITPERMETLHRASQVVAQDHGAFIHEIGGMPDHVHVAVSIPPTITVSEFVGRLKGSSSRFVIRSIPEPEMDVFLWQSQYGVLTFGDQSLPGVIANIENQSHHHSKMTFAPHSSNCQIEPDPIALVESRTSV